MTYSPVGILSYFTHTLYKRNVNSKSRVVYDEVPNPWSHATTNTYAASASFCAYADRSCNRRDCTAGTLELIDCCYSLQLLVKTMGQMEQQEDGPHCRRSTDPPYWHELAVGLME